MNIGILEWSDENSKGDYPLMKSFGCKGVIVDASFMQFDGTIPVLNTVKVEPTTVTFNITFDRITKNIVVTNAAFSDTKSVRIFEIDGSFTRYIGCLVLGQGFFKLFEEKVGTTIQANALFAPNVVVAVNKKSGVFSFQGMTEDVFINTTTIDGDEPIFFGIDGTTVIWNAVGIPEALVSPVIPLKTLNGVSPTNNHVRIDDSEIVKVTPAINGLDFNLANSVLNDNIAPTTNYE